MRKNITFTIFKIKVVKKISIIASTLHLATLAYYKNFYQLMPVKCPEFQSGRLPTYN